LKLATTILTWLLSLPVSKYDASEDYGARTERLQTIADGVAQVAGTDRQLAAYLLTQARAETDFSLDAQTCECKPHRCDRDRDNNIRAAGLFQWHRRPNESVESWRAVCGTTLGSVVTAATRQRLYYRASDIPGSFARSKSIVTAKNEPWVQKRVAEMKRLVGKL
jgi:hypothetical protein